MIRQLIRETEPGALSPFCKYTIRIATMKMIISGIAAACICACSKPADVSSAEAGSASSSGGHNAVQPVASPAAAEALQTPLTDGKATAAGAEKPAAGTAAVSIVNKPGTVPAEQYADKVTRIAMDPEREARNDRYTTEPREKYAEGFSRPGTAEGTNPPVAGTTERESATP